VKFFCGFTSIVLLAIYAWNYLHRPIEYPPGVLIPSEPQQTSTTDTLIARDDFQLTPLAHFAIDARVLHRRIYHWDRQASLVPVDLALGWGPMSYQRVLDQITITQSMRFYWFEYKNPPPISKEEIISHSTNVHVIPATPSIASQCKSLRAGALVHLSGDLVQATTPGFGSWKSSLSRTDTGNGLRIDVGDRIVDLVCRLSARPTSAGQALIDGGFRRRPRRVRLLRLALAAKNQIVRSNRRIHSYHPI